MPSKESTLQQKCINKLTEIGQTEPIFFYSPLNETAMMIMRMFKIPEGKIAGIIKFLKKMGLVPGVPDLVLLYCGQCIYIELKKLGEKPSETQLKIHEKIRASGHRVEVLDTYEKFLELLIFCGVIYE